MPDDLQSVGQIIKATADARAKAAAINVSIRRHAEDLYLALETILREAYLNGGSPSHTAIMNARRVVKRATMRSGETIAWEMEDAVRDGWVAK